MSKQRQIISFLQENKLSEIKDEMFVTITLYRVPASLVRDFGVKVVVQYPGGISDAIQDLMKKAVEK